MSDTQKSDTPRTDREEQFESGVGGYVSAHFAGQLEREVATLTAELDAAKRALTSSLNLFDEILCDPMSDIRKSFADRALVLINLPSAEAALAAKSTEPSDQQGGL